jgi:peptide/nickel transport system ATP-binding protein
MTAMLEVNNLQVSFPSKDKTASKVKALHGVTLSINKGEVVSLVGESGCGKSMTGLALLDLVSPPGHIHSGSIKFEGKDILSFSDDELQKYRGAQVAMIFQEPMTALNPVFTVGQQIDEVIVTHLKVSKAIARKKTVEYLRRVGIPDPETRANSYPFELSGGMRQRAMIAMALSGQPKLLIADEPTTALDVTIQAQILHLLKEICEKEQMAMLFISHDLAVVSNVSDRVCVMYAGKIIEEINAKKILQAKHPYTKGLLASRPHENKGIRLKPVPGQVPELVEVFDGCAFKERCSVVLNSCAKDIKQQKVANDHQFLCNYIEDVSD